MVESVISLLAQMPAPTSAPLSPLPLEPAVILVLCLVAGFGTVLLLPSRREASLRKVGGVILLAAALIFAALLFRYGASQSGGGMGAYFWIFSAIALLGAVRVVTHTKPVYSALYFVLTIFASAGLFLLLDAEFMAASLVLIYAGAILVTYVFVIMLAAEASSAQAFTDHDTLSRDPLLASAIGFALMGTILFLIFDKSAAIPPHLGSSTLIGNTQQLGEFLFTTQVINLELAGLILTIAMVGAIVITRRKISAAGVEESDEVVLGPPTQVNDDPHAIPVYGTTNPRQKEFPET